MDWELGKHYDSPVDDPFALQLVQSEHYDSPVDDPFTLQLVHSEHYDSPVDDPLALQVVHSEHYDSPVDDPLALQVVQSEGQLTDVKHDAVLTEGHFLLHVVTQIPSQQKVRHQEQVLLVWEDTQHTDQQTPWSRALREKLILPQPVKKFPTLYRTQTFIIFI